MAFIEDLNCYIFNLESKTARTLVSEATYSSVLKQNRLATLSKSYASIFDIANIESPTKIHLKNSLQTAFQHGELKFDTHSSSQLFATTGKNLDVYDLRSGKSTTTVSSNFQIRSFDINPNRTDYVTYVTDNRIISTVDVRNQKETISSTETGHNHWVWSVGYNPFHDRLVLTSGSDNRAILYTFFETCSDNVKKSNWQLTDSDSFEDDIDRTDDYSLNRSKLNDGIIQTYEDFDDSVYALSWSYSDPWIFAAVGYDGKVMLSHVPRDVKYSILL